MKFVSQQCKQCPFRKNSLPGWLGNYDVGSIFRAIWKGFPFFCHSAINYKSKTWETKAMKDGKLCVGGLLFAHKILAPERECQHDEIRRARLAVVHYQDKIECMDAKEFGEHHQQGPEKKFG
jgi:hypothetical protein